MNISNSSSGLSTLPKLGETVGSKEVRAISDLLTTFRIYEIDAVAARQPRAIESEPILASDASNLSSFIFWLKVNHSDIFELLVRDMRYISPTIGDIDFEIIGGSTDAVKLVFKENNLIGSTDLADASFGTVRSLALLAMLHDPNPPKLTCIEEIDHGLHPYALDVVVDRLRSASSRSQFIVATHSPAFVNRLNAEEIIICERGSDGASHIPAIPRGEIKEIMRETNLSAGELWFSGALGGVL
ncbi:hypothetical protein D3C78_1270520 [compost metagenome]